MKLAVGLSPCPNDTFIFHALFSGLVSAPGIECRPVMEDVETLNQMARRRLLEVTKISLHAYGHLRDAYTLLDAGAALGRGCGPLVVTRPEARNRDLRSLSIAIPGHWTTAALLLRLHAPEVTAEGLVAMPFDRILAATASGEVGAGLIIHECRFTYAARGLVEKVDLGRWWEEEEGLPLPLGGIIARRDLGMETIETFEAALRASILRARAHPEASRDYVRSHAQELSEEVTRAHIELYVNDFTVALGEEGRHAVDRLLDRAAAAGIISPAT
jgi:1,4-dihydroxy-6-naphthoate synthase